MSGMYAVSESRRVPIGRTMAVGVLTGVVGLIGNAAANYFGDWTNPLTWAAVPAITILFSVIEAFVGAHVETIFEDPDTGRRTPANGLSVPVSVAAVLVVFGIGGSLAVAGAKYGVEWLTGNEAGTDRLVRQVRTEQRGLAMTVTSFEETRHFTRLAVRVQNGVGNSLDLPLFGNCVLIGGDGTAIQVDHRRSDWSIAVPAGASPTGELLFPGHLAEGVRRASLAFSTVFEHGFNGPRSLTVRGIVLEPRGQSRAESRADVPRMVSAAR